ncbi:hypothetical protein BKA56DRAFT_214784 [Ilyonectria sp. MPI-CAGE-AT-0026]|nr:hypothetical protein BKA56DRAFT_214784 [Ilyonectria sp. MPI-CAGE-AT-0026]
MLKLESTEEKAAAILRHLINSKETFEYDEAKEAASAYEVLSPSTPEGVESTNVNAELLMHLACGIREGELPDPVMEEASYISFREEASYISFIKTFCTLYAHMEARGISEQEEAIRLAHCLAFPSPNQPLPPATVIQDIEADRRRLLLLVEQFSSLKDLQIQALKVWMQQGRDYFPRPCPIAPTNAPGEVESMRDHFEHLLNEKDHDAKISRIEDILHFFTLHSQAPCYQVIQALEFYRSRQR